MKDLPLRASQLGIVRCPGCGLACEAPQGGNGPARCPRCMARLHNRRPNSITQAWALLIAAVVLYIPANILPVMYTDFLGSGIESTILNGVIEFWTSGSYAIALVIFTASVAVPCTKFLVLATLLTSAQRHSRWARQGRAKLYRMVELIGYWSMLDVVVVAVIAALVKFDNLSTIEPRIGILFFGIVVILTMLSAMSFDPRLTWDDEQ